VRAATGTARTPQHTHLHGIGAALGATFVLRASCFGAAVGILLRRVGAVKAGL
jgi:hypothetical protein